MMLYLFTSIFVLIVSFVLFQRAAGSLSFSKPNLISYVFYYNIIAQTLIAAILAVLYLDNHYVISRVGMDVRHYAWLAVMYLMIAFPLGMLLAKFIFARGVKMQTLLNSYVNSPIQVSGVSGNSLKYAIWLFTAISMFACLYTFWKIGYFPFLKALTSSSTELGATRIAVSRHFSGNIYVRNFFALAMMPILAYVWIFYYLGSRRLLDLLVAGVTLLFAFSILYYNFAKGPLLWYVLSFVFVYFYALGKFRLIHLIFLGSIAFAGLVAMYALSGVSLAGFASYNTGPVGRIILGQASGLFIMFDIFPERYDFIGFSSLSQFIANLAGYEYVDRAARIAMTYFRPDAVAQGMAGVMNSIFIAEAWANFGLAGVLIAPLWVGFLLQTLYIFFLKSPKNPLYLAFFVSFSIGGSVTGGFNDYIYNPGVVMMVMLFSMIMAVALLFRSFTR